MTLGEFLADARVQLVDPDGVHWPDSELISYIQFGYSAIITQRPDASSKLVTFNCVAGPIQELPTDEPGAMLLGIKRNLLRRDDGIGGYVYDSGRPPRLISGELADSLMETWYSATANPDGQIDEYIYDERLPNRFYVYPNATDSTFVELLLSVLPNKHTSANPAVYGAEELQINARYVGPLMDYVLFKAYQRDSQDTHSRDMAQMYITSFNSALGIKTQVDFAAKPEPIEEDA